MKTLIKLQMKAFSTHMLQGPFSQVVSHSFQSKTLDMLNKLSCHMPTSHYQPIRLLDQIVDTNSHT